MMTLFDNQQWDFALARYEREGDFLRDIVLEEIQEKINDHQREFTKIAIIAKNVRSWAPELPFEAEIFEVQDELHLPSNQFDLVLHLHALHRMNDPVGQMVQARLSLQPDGVFMAAFLGGESLGELRFAFHHAEAETYNGASPHIAPMIEIKDAGNLLARAGLALPIADNFKQQVRYPSTYNLLRDLQKLGLSNPLSERRKTFTRQALFSKLTEIYTENFACDDGRVYASFEEIFLTGYAPSENQPKALRPGSINKPFGADMEN